MSNFSEVFHRWYDRWREVARILFDIFFRPRAKNDEAWRKEFILNTVLLTMIGLVCVFAVILVRNAVVFGPKYNGVPLWMFFSAFVFILVLYGLSRLGYRLLSSYLLVGMLFSANALTNYHWGIDLPGILLSYGFLVVMTGILINSWVAFIVTAAIAAVLNCIGYLQLHGYISTAINWRSEMFTQRDGVEFSVYFMMIAAISWLSNREIDQSMHRAFRSERALMRQREALESLVEERTNQLREAQIQRIDQLYRFAEFGKLASGFFHDLSSPLATLQLYLDEIELHSDQAVADVRSDIQKAQAVALHIENFTAEMKRQLRESSSDQVFSVGDEIRSVVQIMSHRILTSSAEVLVNCPDEVLAFGNPLRFHQVILNLLANAIDAYDVFSAGTKKLVELEVFQDRLEAGILVSDHAGGFPEELHNRIFEPFFTTKAEKTNMGIGLATTKSIIEKDFGGKISVQSSVNVGTVFKILIPKRNADA